MFNALVSWLRESFESPWLLLLLPLTALVWIPWLRRRRSTILYSSLDSHLRQPPTWAVRSRIVLPILRTLAVALLLVCLARPRKGNELTRVTTEGIAIQLCLDRSGSMRAMDFKEGNQRVDRLSIVKKVATEFIKGGGDLKGRPDDMIGTIVFARFADSQCPLTLDHDFLIDTLRKAEVAQTQAEDGTAIGDAIALGVERLRSLDTTRNSPQAPKIKSRVMILMTDGENNAGDIEPLKAAEMAAALGIKMYTIGTGTRGFALVPVQDVFGNTVLQNARVSIDEDTLTKIADLTGGKYFRATDTDSLKEIYAQIDKLERTKTEERRFMQYKELATESVRIGSLWTPPLLAVAFAMLVIEMILANTRLRSIP